MRTLRVVGLILVVAAAGVLSGAAAGAAPTTAALTATAAGVLPADSPPTPAPPPEAGAAAPGSDAVPPPPPVPFVVAGTPCLSTARACIDLSENHAWLIRDGVVEYGPVPITHGRKGYRTPPGTFHVTFKDRHHRSTLFNDAPMPYSVFFNGGIAFHQGSLRVPSHGCIHLSRAAATTFFGSLSRGDVVQVVR